MVKPAILLVLFTALISCNKDKNDDRETVSDSIYGIYFKEANTGNWLEDILGSTSIKVAPVSATYIEIIVNYNSIYPVYIHDFDSVKLSPDNSFTVDQIIKDGNSSSGYAHATGSGNFGLKTISLNFHIDREGPIGDENIVWNNEEKIKD